MFYDPMICKLITHGKTRDSALDRLRACLDAYVIRGLGHNVAFLRDLTEHKRFIEGRIDTSFIKVEYPAVSGMPTGPPRSAPSTHPVPSPPIAPAGLPRGAAHSRPDQ